MNDTERTSRPSVFRKPARFLFCAAVCALASQSRAAPPTEYEMKAVFMYKLASYIRWPQSATLDPHRPFTIGILGKDPFGRAIDDTLSGEAVEGRPVVVRRLSEIDEATRCDLVFVSSSERSNVRRIIEVLKNTPVLTVGDMDQFAESGGMINLTTDNRRIRFEINVSAIDRVGLKASSQLLTLAKIVDTSAEVRR